jgi:diguanylate cyclase (GGDEF)-like protein
MRGFACVPLLAQGNVIGALCLIDVKPLTLTAPEFDALATFGGVVGSDVLKLPTQHESATVPPRPLLETPPGGLHELLVNDPLTGLATRTRVEQEIAREVSRSQRTRTALSCVLIDVDNLDDVVDTLGRAIADEILQRITRVLNTSIRGSDLAARWGIEEFLLLLPGVPREGARTVAERVRVRVQQLRSTPRITVSAGVVELSAHRTVEEALAEADERLSKAKAEGRNRVV